LGEKREQAAVGADGEGWEGVEDDEGGVVVGADGFGEGGDQGAGIGEPIVGTRRSWRVVEGYKIIEDADFRQVRACGDQARDQGVLGAVVGGGDGYALGERD
jgi:hypothetical protein